MKRHDYQKTHSLVHAETDVRGARCVFVAWRRLDGRNRVAIDRERRAGLALPRAGHVMR